MMKIEIDIDGFLTDIASFQLVRGQKYFGKMINEKGFEIRDIFNCSKSKKSEFWSHNLDYYSLKAREGTSEFTRHMTQNPYTPSQIDGWEKIHQKTF